MNVKRLMEILRDFDENEEVTLSEKETFYNATEENCCDLKNISEVASGVLYGEQEGVVVLLFNKEVK
jgi:hypothetical protein